MFNRRNKFKEAPNEYVRVENVYEILPPYGTIINMATEEEMQVAAELEAKHHALMRMQELNFQIDGHTYKEILKEMEEFEIKSMQFWRGVYNRVSAPWAWALRIDVANGPIFVVNEELLYDAEEGEEEE
ncbi:hypothetical protein PDJ82_09725 [Bacillus cereus group sp. TH43LC]|nr:MULTISPECIES: hypothetical protein [Bacillus cereus group]ASZ16207.1 hypothetical protein CK938_06140 [Bacillus cereus]MBE7144399.1 hypothetical protein [Bacillus paranthracis]MCU5296311.1 hypothetical protein [Bacillus paranthracis]MDA1501871.1 hypothetical protein [Bacillus cereus group sp. TH43LC]MDA1788295.1 hypothetical protein [Bacillus cereus group sp. BY5-1LC]